jgi:hypothetical protein
MVMGESIVELSKDGQVGKCTFIFGIMIIQMIPRYKYFVTIAIVVSFVTGVFALT